MRATTILLGLTSLLLLAPSATRAQTPPKLVFEVASVRPSPPGSRRGPRRGGPGTTEPELLTFEHALFRELLMEAYGVQRDQIKGPDWAIADANAGGALFDVSAKVPPGATKAQAAVMLQNLLEERFHLSVHHETVESSGFALIVAQKANTKKGSQLKPSAGPVAPEERNPTAQGAVKLNVAKDGFPELFPGSNMGGTFNNGAVRIRFRDYPLSDLIEQFSFALGFHLTDKTDLTGKYDFTLEFTPPENAYVVAIRATLPLNASQKAPLNGGPNDEQPDAVSVVSSAMEKQLGLKLEKSKIVVDTIVIDHAEKTPTEN